MLSHIHCRFLFSECSQSRLIETMTRTPLVGLVKRGPWTAEEDLLLKKYIEANGIQRWSTLPQKAGLMRCGKSCRLRWMNHLRPNVKRGQISPDEEDLIIRLHNLLGNRWSLIAGRVPGRTDNEVKNYWNTHLSKKLASRSVSRGKAVTQIVEEQPLSCGDHQKGKAKPMITLVEGSHFKITHDKSSSKIQTTKNAIVSDNHSFGSVSLTDSTALPVQFEQDYPDSQLADANMKYSGTELPDSTILGDGYKFGRAEDQFFSGTGSIAPWFIEINMEEDIFLPITRFEQGISTTELCSDSFISSWTCSDNLLGE